MLSFSGLGGGGCGSGARGGLSGQSEGSAFCTMGTRGRKQARQQEVTFRDTLAVPEADLDFLINLSQSDSDNSLIRVDREHPEQQSCVLLPLQGRRESQVAELRWAWASAFLRGSWVILATWQVWEPWTQVS